MGPVRAMSVQPLSVPQADGLTERSRGRVRPLVVTFTGVPQAVRFVRRVESPGLSSDPVSRQPQDACRRLRPQVRGSSRQEVTLVYQALAAIDN